MANTAYHARLLALATLEDLQHEMTRLGVDRGGIPIMAAKGILRLIRVEQIPTPAANIIKQEILARGGDLATPWSASAFAAPAVDVIFIGSLTTLRSTISKLYRQPVYDLPAIADAVQLVLMHTTPGYLPVARQPRRQGIVVEETMDDLVGGRLPLDPGTHRATGLPVCPPVNEADWQFGRLTYVAAPISAEAVLGHAGADPAADAVAAGAHILVVETERCGGEGPAQSVAAAVGRIRARCPAVPVAVRTGLPDAAEAALEAGTGILCLAGAGWEAILPVAASSNAILVLPDSQAEAMEEDPVAAMAASFGHAMERAMAHGAKAEQLVLHVGLGLGKIPARSRTVLRRLRELTSLGRPLWVAPDLGEAPQQPESEGAASAALAMAVANGANFIEIAPAPGLLAAVRTADMLTRDRDQH